MYTYSHRNAHGNHIYLNSATATPAAAAAAASRNIIFSILTAKYYYFAHYTNGTHKLGNACS